jgi:hypothetical protein
MTHQTEPDAKSPFYDRGTSSGAHKLDLGIRRPPESARAALPQAYGIALLELLIVDPEYVFVSWEITAEQLDQTRENLGIRDFEQRRLIIRLRNADNDGEILTEQELYGETGRWFIRHNLAGRRVTAELGFRPAQGFIRLSAAGPVELPRDFVVEPRQFEELHVQYGMGPTGELVIEGVRKREQDAWPEINLPLPSTTELAVQHGSGVQEASRGMPSSAEFGWPGSPGSCGFLPKTDAPAGSGRDGEQ